MVVTKGMYTYTLKVTRHLGHFFILLPLPDRCVLGKYFIIEFFIEPSLDIAKMNITTINIDNE